MDTSEEKIFYQGSVTLPSRLRAFAGAVLTWLVVGIGAGEDYLAKGSHNFHFWFLVIVCAAAVARVMVLFRQIRPRRVTLTVTEKLLRIAIAHPMSGRVWEEDEIDRARIAAIVHKEDKQKKRNALLVLDAAGKTLADLRVDSPAVAYAVMQALDLPPAPGRNTYQIAGPLSGPVTGMLLAAAVAGGLITASLGIGSWWWLAAVAVLTLAVGWPSSLSVARDGVYLRSTFGGKFVAFRDLRTIERASGGKTIHFVEKDGTRTKVPALMPTEEQTGDPLYTRLRDELTAFQAGGAKQTLTSLDREDGTTAAWIARLRGLRTRDDYRTAAITDDALLAVVEDHTAAEEARAAAAVALRAAGDEANQRIRVAAEATGSPKLRVALEAATHDDDDATALALDEVAPRRRRA